MLSRDVYLNICTKCVSKYKQKDCLEIKIIEYQRTFSKRKSLEVYLDLYYEVIKYIYDESSIYKLVVDLISIQSIFFGLNFIKLLKGFNYVIEKKIKIKGSKIAVYLVCLLGFSYHLGEIFNEVLNGELVLDQYYKELKKIEMSDVIFCIEYDKQLVDDNYKLTGSYLMNKSIL